MNLCFGFIFLNGGEILAAGNRAHKMMNGRASTSFIEP
jgi:hypothetical protein